MGADVAGDNRIKLLARDVYPAFAAEMRANVSYDPQDLIEDLEADLAGSPDAGQALHRRIARKLLAADTPTAITRGLMSHLESIPSDTLPGAILCQALMALGRAMGNASMEAFHKDLDQIAEWWLSGGPPQELLAAATPWRCCRMCPTLLTDLGARYCGTCCKGMHTRTAELVFAAWRVARRTLRGAPSIQKIYEYQPPDAAEDISLTTIKKWRRLNLPAIKAFEQLSKAEQKAILYSVELATT